MQEHGHCTSGVGLGASANGATVSIYVDHHPPFLRLKRAVPWDALCEVMGRPGRRAGKTTAGRPGVSWDMALSVPLVVVMLVQHLHARAREAYRAEHGVARGFIGQQDDPRPQIRDHANSARAYAALGQDGGDASNAWMLHVATDVGLADPSLRSSATPAQEWPMGYPNAPGMVRGGAQRCGRALQQRTTRAVVGVDRALAPVATILRAVQDPHRCAKSKSEKRQGLTRLLPEGGPWVVSTRPRVPRLGQRRARVTQRATATLVAMHEVAKRLIPQSVPWSTTGVGAKGKIVHAGWTPARAIVRNQAGNKVECGLPYLLRRLGGGEVCGTLSRGVVDESKRP
jgi:hypothetical protein